MRTIIVALTALAAAGVLNTASTEPSSAAETVQAVPARKNLRRPFEGTAVAPLADAVASGSARRIRRLAPASDLSARGDLNVTLLEWAIWNEQPRSLAALLEAGADSKLLGMDQETVAHMAAMARSPRYLTVLIDKGAAIDVVSPRANYTPIFRAVQSRRDKQVDMLIKAGAKLNRVDSMGNTLLHVAATINDANRVLQLLEAGVDPRAKNAQGSTFQKYLFDTPETSLTAKAKVERQRVRAWLSEHGIASE